MYEHFEHTADLGLRIRAASLDELFADAGRALFSIVVNLEQVRPVQEVELRIEGADREYLLFDWLSELLYRFDSEGLLLGQFRCRLDSGGLTAICHGEIAEPAHHELDHEVKAITYHGLKLERQADEWLAEVIVDI